MKDRKIYDLVKRLRAAEGPLDPSDSASREMAGSKGWHTRGYLPHADFPGTLQMITFRLADAMPAAKRHEWEKLFLIEDQRKQRTKLEDYLDRGYGACWLNKSDVANDVERTLLHSDGRLYRLVAWVIMPNHVHVLVELWKISLSELMKVWKGASSNAINKRLERSGQLWQEDYWDRFIRDETHFRKARNYIERNPVKVGLVKAAAAWAWTSANGKWLWTGQNRYHLAQLVHANAGKDQESVQGPAVAEGTVSERGFSCPLATGQVLYNSAGEPVGRTDTQS